jgi:hypothetical protein
LSALVHRSALPSASLPRAARSPRRASGRVAVADFYKGSNLLIGSKSRIAGLTLRATDADWSHGTGPGVEGPILSLVMAMTGRTAADDDLAGDGVATLRSRS